MTADEAFFTVHADLPREGPGCDDDVAWAIAEAGLSGPVRICDAGCGPGADSVAFARALPDARITAIDAHAAFVAQARAALVPFGARAEARQDDMAAIEGPFDLIWSAGAVYFLGVTEALSRWRGALAEGGAVAFSEPVLLGGAEPEAVHAFWQEYPQITDLDGLRARVAAAGFSVRGLRRIVGAPWAAYYDPLSARLDRLEAQDPGPELAAAIAENRREIALWRAARDRVAYALLLVRPT